MTKLKVTTISDTHNKINQKIFEPCDVLIHAGDATMVGDLKEFDVFIKWMKKQPANYKIFVAGNHDKKLDNTPWKDEIIKKLEDGGITYLCNSSVIIEGVKFYGSPYTPTFFNWAFMRDAGNDIEKEWKKMQIDSDVVITHGPSYKILDKCPSRPILDCNGYPVLDSYTLQPLRTDPHVGCKSLKNMIDIVKPAVHVFGHIHESAGAEYVDGILMINACLIDGRYFSLKKKPHSFLIEVEEIGFKRTVKASLIE